MPTAPGGRGSAKCTILLSRVRLVNDRLFCVNRQGLQLVARAHFLPVVIKFLPAIEANDVSAPARSFRPGGVAGWGNREGCPPMRATKKNFEQRIQHIDPSSTSIDSAINLAVSRRARVLPLDETCQYQPVPDPKQVRSVTKAVARLRQRSDGRESARSQ